MSNKHEIGDYYRSNAVEGVVFWLDDSGEHGKIVSLDEARLPWCKDCQYRKEIVVGALFHDEGINNSYAVLLKSNINHHPAFAWCVSKGVGWYLPSRCEVLQLYHTMQTVNLTLDELGQLKNSDLSLWTSTEHDEYSAYEVRMADGDYKPVYKGFPHYVRAIYAF